MKRLFFALLAALLFLQTAHAFAFTVYDTTMFKHKPANLKQRGFIPLEIIYEDDFFRSRKGSPTSDPDLVLARTIANRVKANADIVCIDIECWDIINANQQTLQTNINRLISVVDAMHAAAPKLRIGYYGTLPVVDYWAPAGDNKTKLDAWEKANKDLQAVAKHVDIIFPSLYTYYDDPAGWKKYAIATLLEAKRYGKPVYAFLWYQYHESNKFLGMKPIPTTTWRMQLETCYKYADGIVIWGGYKERWEDRAAWWMETESFLNDLPKRKEKR